MQQRSAPARPLPSVVSEHSGDTGVQQRKDQEVLSGTSATVHLSQRKCACDKYLVPRLVQKGPNRGRMYWACADRNPLCHRIFIWDNPDEVLVAPTPVVAQCNPESGSCSDVVLLARQRRDAMGGQKRPSIQEQLLRRRRAHREAADMGTHAYAARGFTNALQAVKEKRARSVA